jgi:hypothetical protein
LATDFRAGDVSAAESREGETHAIVQRPCAAKERLQLVFAEAVVIVDRSVEFAAERKARFEVVLKRQAAGVNVAVGGLDSENAGTGVAGKEESEVGGGSSRF